MWRDWMNKVAPKGARWIPTLVALLSIAPLAWGQDAARYPCEREWIEVMFDADSRVRLRGERLQDLGAPALAGVDQVLQSLAGHDWHRLSPVPEEELDALQARAAANAGRELYDMNNVYRLRIEGGEVWEVSARLEALPGVQSARPVPLPIDPPVPPQYEQEYFAPAAWTPSGTSNDYSFLTPLGDGTGFTICDLEYSWNYNHADISKAQGSQINTNVADPFSNTDHGTAVIGMLSADDNGWGIRGLCPGATLRTCGTYFGTPPVWNPAGAIMVAISQLPPGSVMLLEQQWKYNDPTTPDPNDYVPIEWYTNTYPSNQSYNSVYAAIELAVANRIYVIEAGGNGAYDTDNLAWYADSGAFVIGAGGAYPGGPLGGGNLERMSFSSYGWRFNLQGWGENVITTGYGDLHQEGPTENYDYTSVFAGTSSASAHVAAAVACYSAFASPTFGVADPVTMRSLFVSMGTAQVFGPSGKIGPRPDLLRHYVALAPPPYSYGGDYGDAPEGVLAYPMTGVIGSFPTVFGPTTPATFMMHAQQPSPLLYLGHSLDYEYDANAGIPFLEFITYDADECYDPAPSDDGLLLPAAFTVQGSSVVPCTPGPIYLAAPCSYAHWGVDIDFEVVNVLPDDAWLNVLIDWDQDGEWGGTSMCGNRVAELAVSNLRIPHTGLTPVAISTLLPGLPPIRIGPNDGHVWARVTLTDLPLNNPASWEGALSEPSGAGWGGTVIGETEDYLLQVGLETAEVRGNAGEVGPVRTMAFPNPFAGEIAIRFQLAQAVDVSIDLFDIQGRWERRLQAGPLAAGRHEVTWDGLGGAGARAPAGVYLCKIRGEGVDETVKLLLSR